MNFFFSKIEIGELEIDEILCREAIICGDIMKYKEDILHLKFNLEKKSSGKSMTELISRTLNFELLQELPKSIAIDLNFNDIKLSPQNIEQILQSIQNIQKLRSLRLFYFLPLLFLFSFFYFLSFLFQQKKTMNRIQRCSLSKENLLLIFRSLLINLQVNDSLQIIE